MAFTLYDAASPLFIRGLESLSALIDKAAAELDEAAVLEGRLAPDMRPFTAQVQMTCFAARGCVSRLTGVAAFRTEDDEASLAELKDTVTRTIEYLKSVPASAFEGAETRPIEVKAPAFVLHFDGAGYLTSFAIPNFHFHLVTAYDILRHLGLQIGKRDYLGQLALSRPPEPIEA